MLLVRAHPQLGEEDHALSARAIVTVFAACFADHRDPDVRAQLVRGGDEPLYRPATRWRPWAEVIYARDLAASCLHEAAHWLRAGRERRQLVDYGYWYEPDGRDDAAQARFEQAEVEIQAIEWILATCAGVRFHISADNLRSPEPSRAFRLAIGTAVERRLTQPLHGRLTQFANALADASGRCVPGLREAALAWDPANATVERCPPSIR